QYKAFHPKRESQIHANGNPKSPQTLGRKFLRDMHECSTRATAQNTQHRDKPVVEALRADGEVHLILQHKAAI
ncbi:hypothetical protein, partial [Qipengyuania qiaonensis]